MVHECNAKHTVCHTKCVLRPANRWDLAKSSMDRSVRSTLAFAVTTSLANRECLANFAPPANL